MKGHSLAKRCSFQRGKQLEKENTLHSSSWLSSCSVSTQSARLVCDIVSKVARRSIQTLLTRNSTTSKICYTHSNCWVSMAFLALWSAGFPQGNSQWLCNVWSNFPNLWCLVSFKLGQRIEMCCRKTLLWKLPSILAWQYHCMLNFGSPQHELRHL